MTEATVPSSLAADRSRRGLLLSLAVLLLIAGAQRIWLMTQAPVIAQDGIMFLGMAEQLADSPGEAIKRSPLHPGFPAAVAVVHQLLETVGHGGRAAWELAGQIVALLSSLAAISAVWLIGLRSFKDARIAWIGALLFAIGKKFAALGADVYSDSLMLALMLWAILAGWSAARRLQAKRKSFLYLAGVCGLLTAGAYYVRPEGVVALFIVLAVWLSLTVFRRSGWRWSAIAAAVAVAVSAAATLPYMLYIGRFTAKWSAEEFVRAEALRLGPLLAEMKPYSTDVFSPIRLVGRFFEAAHPVVATLIALYLLVLLLRAVPSIRPYLPAPLRITRLAAATIVITWLLVSPPVVLRYRATGAMSHRYLLLPAALMAPLAGAAVMYPYHAIRRRLREAAKGDDVRTPRWLAAEPWLVTAVVGIAIAWHSLEAPHKYDEYTRRAGEWIAARARPSQCVLTNETYVKYYSGMMGQPETLNETRLRFRCRQQELSPEQLLGNYLNRYDCEFAAVTESLRSPGLYPVWREVLTQRGYRPVAEFADRPGKPKRLLHVYRKPQ